MKVKIACFSLLLTLGLHSVGSAHPHVFIDCDLVFVFDSEGLAGIIQRWVFDEMFSTMILAHFDQDKDAALDPDEVNGIRKGAFANLQDYNYFTHIQIGGNKYVVEKVTDFYATVQDNRLIYTFFVPCRVSAARSLKKIQVAIYDDTYYTDVKLGIDTPSFDGGDELYSVDYGIDKSPDLSYYGGQIVPEAITVRFRHRK